MAVGPPNSGAPSGNPDGSSDGAPTGASTGTDPVAAFVDNFGCSSFTLTLVTSTLTLARFPSLTALVGFPTTGILVFFNLRRLGKPFWGTAAGKAGDFPGRFGDDAARGWGVGRR